MKKLTQILILLLCLVFAKPLAVRGDDPLPVAGNVLLAADKGDDLLNQTNIPYLLSIPALMLFAHAKHKAMEMAKVRAAAQTDYDQAVKDKAVISEKIGKITRERRMGKLTPLLDQAEAAVRDGENAADELIIFLDKELPGKPTKDPESLRHAKNLPDLQNWLQLGEGRKFLHTQEGQKWFREYSALTHRAVTHVENSVNAFYTAVNEVFPKGQAHDMIYPRSRGSEVGAFMTESMPETNSLSYKDLRAGLEKVERNCLTRETNIGKAIAKGKSEEGFKPWADHYLGGHTRNSRHMKWAAGLGGGTVGIMLAAKTILHLDQKKTEAARIKQLYAQTGVQWEEALDDPKSPENQTFKRALQELIQKSLLAHEQDIVTSLSAALTGEDLRGFDINKFVAEKIRNPHALDRAFRGSVPRSRFTCFIPIRARSIK